MCVHEAQRKLNIALYKMSPDLAGLIKEALGQGPEVSVEGTKAGHKTPTLNIPGHQSSLETIQERLQGKFHPTSFKETTTNFHHAKTADNIS